MTCQHPNCSLTATRLIQIEARPAGPHSDRKATFIPGFITCAPHAPDISQIGTGIKEAIGSELDKVGGRRPFRMVAVALPIDGPEARAYFASKGN